MLNKEIFENETIVNEGFKIDSPSKADWAIKKIKKARERKEIYLSVISEKMEELKIKKIEAEEKYRQETEYLLRLLGEYMEQLPCKETKTQKSFEFPEGKLVKKKAKRDFECNSDELTKHLLGTEFVESKLSLKWAEYKKTLSIVGDCVVDADGEIIDCISLKEIPESVEIK